MSTDLKQTIISFDTKSEELVILGMVSNNRELFLFDQQINIQQPIEVWLSQT